MPEVLLRFLPLIVMFGLFYILLIRPQKKREEEKRNMINAISVGDKIVTIGGIHGKVVILKEDLITIETSGMDTRIEISKWAVRDLQ